MTVLCTCGREFLKNHGLQVHINRLRMSQPNETHAPADGVDPEPEGRPSRPLRAKRVHAQDGPLVEVKVSVLGTELTYAAFLSLLDEMLALKAAMANSTKPADSALLQRQPT